MILFIDFRVDPVGWLNPRPRHQWSQVEPLLCNFLCYLRPGLAIINMLNFMAKGFDVAFCLFVCFSQRTQNLERTRNAVICLKSPKFREFDVERTYSIFNLLVMEFKIYSKDRKYTVSFETHLNGFFCIFSFLYGNKICLNQSVDFNL